MCVCVCVFWCFVLSFALLVFGGLRAMPCSLPDLSSSDRDQTFDPGEGSTDSQPPGLQGTPSALISQSSSSLSAPVARTQLPWCVCVSHSAERAGWPIQCGRVLINQVSSARSGPLSELCVLGANKWIRSDTHPPLVSGRIVSFSVCFKAQNTHFYFLFPHGEETVLLDESSSHTQARNWKPGS